jgi:hypothetical protein
MKYGLLFLGWLTGALLALAPTAFAQAVDRISSINGDSGFASDEQTRYFNREDCGLGGAGGTGGTGGTGAVGGSGGTGGSQAAPKADPSETTFEIRLDNTGGALSTVFLWVGKQNAQCNLASNRNETMGTCAELSGNPRSVGSNFLVSGLTLQDLLDARAGGTEIVTCESSGLTGTPYEIFGFRNQDPGAGDVEASAYGIAEFYVDVEPPNPPLISTDPQRQATFNITWGDPDPPDLIQRWSFLFSDTDDPLTAAPLGITASLNERSQTISAATLGLAAGGSGYIFMTAFDQAFVSNELGGNESEVSEGVMVTNVEVTGVCDATGECSGCSASPMSLAGGSGQIAWVLALLLLVACVVRRRR